MADFSVVFDPMLDKERAEFDNGSGGSGGSSYVGGDRINIAGGTISFVNSADIVNVTGTSVTLQPDTAYKIYATSQAITLNANPPAAGKWAYEGHLEIFTAGTGYIVTGSNVVLANALEPDAVNNCTVRFHDGIAIISVEDHVAGYIVVNGSTSGDGSLYYGIATSTNDYVAFDASLNGQPIPLAGAVAEGEKHVVGNGYNETTLTGAVDCGTSKFTVANLSLQNVAVNGGTMTLGDVFIPNSATVAVSGGGLVVEKVTGNGGTIDLGGTNVVISSGTTASASGCTFSGGSTVAGGAFFVSGGACVNLYGCDFVGNQAGSGGALFCYGPANLTSCSVSGNGTIGQGDIYMAGNAAICSLNGGCVVGNVVLDLGGSVVFKDNNSIGNIKNKLNSAGRGGTVTISSGATLDLTGNTNPTPVAPGGGITFEQGGATVYPSAGQASAYMLGGMTVPTIGNTNVVNLGGSNVFVSSGATAYANGCHVVNGASAFRTSRGTIKLENCVFSGNATALNQTLGNISATACVFAGNSAAQGGAVYAYYGAGTYSACVFSSNSASALGGAFQISDNTATLVSCSFDGNVSPNYADALGIVGTGKAIISGCSFGTAQNIQLRENANVTLIGSNALGGSIKTRGGTGDSDTVTISSGAILNFSGNASSAVIKPKGSITFGANVTIINSAGTSVSLNGGVAGSCSQINNDGTIA